MLNPGEGYISAAVSPNRTVSALVKCVFLDGSSETLNPIQIVSYKVTQTSVTEKVFAPGNFIASQLELVVNKKADSVENMKFERGVKLHPVAQIISTQVYSVDLGDFWVEQDGVSEGTDGYITIKALSINPAYEEQFSLDDFEEHSGSIETSNVANLLDYIRYTTGVAIHRDSFDTKVFPNLLIALEKNFSMITSYRDALAYVAEVLGASVGQDKVSGATKLHKIFNGVVDIGCVLDSGYLFEVDKKRDLVQPFQFLSIKANPDDLGVTKEVDGVTTNYSYNIINNPITYGHPEDFLDGLVEPTSFTEFYPAKISFHGRPDLEVGDVVQYVYEGETFILPIGRHIFEYNGGFKSTIESFGSNEQKAVSNTGLKSYITALRQSINSLIRDLTQTQSEIVDINGELSNVSTLLQTANSLSAKIAAIEGSTSNISTLLQTATTLSARLSAVEGDLEKVASLELLADSFQLNFQTLVNDLKDTQNTVNENHNMLLSYFDFKADGLTIGTSSSNIKLKLSNDKIQFLKDGVTEVAYLSQGKLYVTDGHFLTSLVLGNFEFVPRTNGNLSLRRR